MSRQDEFIDGLSDEDFTDLATVVISTHTELTEAGRDVYRHLQRPRESRFLRTAIYEAFSGQGKPAPVAAMSDEHPPFDDIV
jgi:hypothetical protein